MKKSICWFLILLLVLGNLSGVTLAAPNEYSISSSGINFIKNQEGFLQYKIWDNSQYSIGYGSACSKDAYPNGITREEAEVLLQQHLVGVEKKLNEFLVGNNIPVGQAQYDALVSFSYNVGVNWLKDSRLADLFLDSKDGIGFSAFDFASAVGVWCHVGKSISSGLVTRRVRELKLFLHGDYTGYDSPDYVYLQVDVAGGDFLPDIYFYPKGKAYGVFPKTTKKNATFQGWYDSSGKKVTESTIAEGNLRVTARWQNPQAASKVFSDLKEDEWFYGYVDELYNGGVVNGFTDGTIRPRSIVSIGEALKMIFLASGYPERPPTLLDPYQWASGYRALAIQLGIFEPDEATVLSEPATRSLVAEIAAKSLKLTETKGVEDAFVDTVDPNVLALYLEGIVLGSLDAQGNRYYHPNDSITRAEIFTIVSRIMNR